MNILKNRRFELNGFRLGSLALALCILGSSASIAEDKDWLHSMAVISGMNVTPS